MNFQCPKCLWIHQLEPGDTRLPPWCKKCGVDVKPDEWRATQTAPAEEVRPRVSRLFANFDNESQVTQVTGTGGKPWLNPPQPAPQFAPVEEPLPFAETATLEDEPAPATEADPNATAVFAVMKYVGIALLVIALVLAARGLMPANNEQTVKGRVAVVWKPEPLAFALWRAERVIEYEMNGVKYQIPAGNREEGESVELAYSPAEPQNARINRPSHQWTLLLVAGGFMLLAGGFVGGWAAAWNRKSKAAPAGPTEP
jgi:hypothetical protein